MQFCAGRSAQALRVRAFREREILRKHVELLDHAIEQIEFLMQGGMTLRWQCVRRIYNHCTQPACDLDVLRPVKADFAESQMHKILPIWRPENHAKFPSSIENLIGAQIAPSGTSQKPVKLIDGQHGGRRIIDRLGAP